MPIGPIAVHERCAFGCLPRLLRRAQIPMSSIQPVTLSSTPPASPFQANLQRIRLIKAASEVKQDAPDTARSEKVTGHVDSDRDGD